MGQNGTFDLGHPGEPLDRWLPRIAGIAAALGAALWFYAHMAPGLAFGPWQGRLLAQHPLYPAPPITQCLCNLATMLPWGATAWKFNLVSAGAGALACGALAAITTASVRPRTSWGAALGAGLFAAALFAALPGMLQESAAAGPATITTAAILLAVALVLLRVESRPNALRMAAAGVFSGCAAADNPALALMAAILLFGIVLGREPLPPSVLAGRMAAFCMGFFLAASIPVTQAISTGETFSQFLFHALQSSYPMLTAAAPRWDVFREIAADSSPVLLVLGLSGALFLLRTGVWGALSMLLAIIACLGLLLPLLTHPAPPHILWDNASPWLLFGAALCALAAAGLAPVGACIARGPFPSRLTAIVLLPAITAALMLSWPQAPNRRHRNAEALARELLQDCSKNTLIVCADPHVASLLLGALTLPGIDWQGAILPPSALLDPGLRPQLPRWAPPLAPMSPAFPDPDALNRWKKQLPFYWQDMTLLAQTGKMYPWTDFALWDFVMQNPERWPLFFAGVDAPWLAARAQPRGWLLSYPEEASRETLPAHRLLNIDWPNDPDCHRTLAALFLPQSDNALRQGRGKDAEEFAAAALRLHPQLDAAAALMRARANAGMRSLPFDDTGDAAPWLRRNLEPLRDAIQEGLDQHAALDKLNRFLAEPNVQDSTAGERDAIFLPFWATDNLFAVVRGYDTLLFANPSDMDALYQAAAIHAQLGHFTAANRYLERWAQTTGHSPDRAAEKIAADGRFAPLLIYREYALERSEKIPGNQGEKVSSEEPVN